jgi:hypothetical protein
MGGSHGLEFLALDLVDTLLLSIWWWKEADSTLLWECVDSNTVHFRSRKKKRARGMGQGTTIPFKGMHTMT